MKSSIVERRRWLRRRRINLRAGEGPIFPSDAELFLRTLVDVLNNRIVAFFAFKDLDEVEPILIPELRGYLDDVLEVRVLPNGKRLKAKTIYRVLFARGFRGSVFGRTHVRIKLWENLFTRNERSVAEVDQLALAFHRQAAELLSRGENPFYLLEQIDRDNPPMKKPVE